MSEFEGRWARLPNGRLVRIIGVDGDVVVAETTAGRTEDRPIAHVRARWTILADDSLTVQAATKPDALKARLEANPVDVVVDAIRELGGQADTARIQELLEQTIGTWVGTREAFKEWWRRVQQKLGDDPRIDDSRSLERRYRLLGEGESKRQPLRDRVSDEWRGGRRLAFAPLLKSARERARKKKPLSEDERIELEAEAALADLLGLDPTDRFMAAELGTWIRLRTVAEAVAVLSEDLLLLDLLRIPHRASRDVALDWLSAWLDAHAEDWTWQRAGAPPTLASAAALGEGWADAAASLAARIGVTRGALVEGAIAWSHPGSEESRPWKLPSDYVPYVGRLGRFERLLARADPEILVGIERGALRALAGVAGSPKHISKTQEVVGLLARLTTGARRRLEAAAKAPPAVVAELPAKRLEALLQVPSGSGGGWARTYLAAVELAFERDPDVYAGAVRLLGTLIGEDPGAIAVRVARRVAKRERIPTLAAVAAGLADAAKVRADSAALAGTADPDDPRVAPVIANIATSAADAVLVGEIDAPGMVVFTPASWHAFAARMHAQLRAADERESAADAAMADATRRITEAQAAAEQARNALAGTRLSSESESRVLSARLAANILKPIAAALADSIEAPSLEALQDRLAAALDRARIEPILQPGEVRPFDPDVHRWVDDGEPTDLVTAVSPGFIARLEGEDDVVLVPARVVAPPQG